MSTELKACTITQGFGGNTNVSYASAGLTGHTGVDEHCGYGWPVYSLKHGWVYKVLDAGHPANDGSGYWAVFIITSDGDLCEWQIGHLSQIYVKPGDKVFPWTMIGAEGNRGKVYQGGVEITKEMQDAGDKRGSHRHWNKKRLEMCDLSTFETKAGQYITAYRASFPPKAYRDEAGFYYRVLDVDNGYNGSVDCMDDLVRGYKAVSEYFWPPVVPDTDELDTELVKGGIELSKEAIKYPTLWEGVMALLRNLASYLKK